MLMMFIKHFLPYFVLLLLGNESLDTIKQHRLIKFRTLWIIIVVTIFILFHSITKQIFAQYDFHLFQSRAKLKDYQRLRQETRDANMLKCLPSSNTEGFHKYVKALIHQIYTTTQCAKRKITYSPIK